LVWFGLVWFGLVWFGAEHSLILAVIFHPTVDVVAISNGKQVRHCRVLQVSHADDLASTNRNSLLESRHTIQIGFGVVVHCW
jgi:hypothetical protein